MSSDPIRNRRTRMTDEAPNKAIEAPIDAVLQTSPKHVKYTERPKNEGLTQFKIRPEELVTVRELTVPHD